MVLWISALLFLTTAGVGLTVQRRAQRRRREARQRRVEQPNSYYSAPGVQRLADLERWGGIDLDWLHPLNRDEVRRLLRRARGAGADVLSAKERQFLDTMAGLRWAEQAPMPVRPSAPGPRPLPVPFGASR